jgi:hypothetical protein
VAVQGYCMDVVDVAKLTVLKDPSLIAVRLVDKSGGLGINTGRQEHATIG